MPWSRRRSLVALAAAAVVAVSCEALIRGLAFPPPLIAGQRAQSAGVRVAAGQDRFGKQRQIGVSATTFKVSAADTAGALFVIEQANDTKGGPPRHLHYEQDEFWYVLAGDYIFEIGSERYAPKPGDSILGPRGIPHAWAFVGDSPGRLLIAFAPAGKMQENFERDRKAGEYRSDAETFRAYGMELVGPPLSIK